MGEPAAALFPSGLVLGRYRPLRPLGSGGSGSVWLARDERHGLDVALKIVPREGKAGPRAEREARAAAHLRHPRCLRAYALARDGDHVYVAYEYVPGRTLRDALRRGELTDADSLEAAAQILEGLAHAHARGIVHRDVKPANVLLTDDERVSVRILDFGLAQLPDTETLTATGDVPGTLAYIPPERLRGEQATPAADVWAVGVVLWESLAGRHPFWSGSVVETAKLIQSGAPSLAALRPDLPKGLLALVERALDRDPARRPSAAQLADELRHARSPRRPREGLVRRPRVALPALPAPRLPLAERLAPAGFAALYAGWSATQLPFYPAGFAPALALLAGALALLRGRTGLAVALAVPVLPLGNVALGLALVYAALALAWLALFWRDPRSGLALVLGPLLGPAGALGLLPLALAAVRSPVRRAALAAAGVVTAALAAGLAGAPLPFTGRRPPLGLGLAGSESPLAVASTLVHALAAQPALAVEAGALAAAAAALPLFRGRGLWPVAGLGAGLLLATLLPAPSAHALPLVVTAWVTFGALGALELPRRAQGEH